MCKSLQLLAVDKSVSVKYSQQWLLNNNRHDGTALGSSVCSDGCCCVEQVAGPEYINVWVHSGAAL